MLKSIAVSCRKGGSLEVARYRMKIRFEMVEYKNNTHIL